MSTLDPNEKVKIVRQGFVSEDTQTNKEFELGHLPPKNLLDIARNECAIPSWRIAAVEYLMDKGFPEAGHPDIADIVWVVMNNRADQKLPEKDSPQAFSPWVRPESEQTHIPNITAETTPGCEKHDRPMVLSLHDRPGSPPGNHWECEECVKERTVTGLPDSVQAVALNSTPKKIPGLF